jgi:hypothetical protein
MGQFKKEIADSSLSDRSKMSATQKAELYDTTLSKLLDAHAPLITKTIKIKHTSPW